jgi:hypothetical protein
LACTNVATCVVNVWFSVTSTCSGVRPKASSSTLVTTEAVEGRPGTLLVVVVAVTVLVVEPSSMASATTAMVSVWPAATVPAVAVMVLPLMPRHRGESRTRLGDAQVGRRHHAVFEALHLRAGPPGLCQPTVPRPHSVADRPSQLLPPRPLGETHHGACPPKRMCSKTEQPYTGAKSL